MFGKPANRKGTKTLNSPFV